MSDTSQGPGWWQASDGKWYPPKDADQAPAPGWWLAADGKWYPPVVTDEAPAPGWWLAADGNWYPPERRPGTTATATDASPTTTSAGTTSTTGAAAGAAKPAAAKPVAPKPVAPKLATGTPGARPAKLNQPAVPASAGPARPATADAGTEAEPANRGGFGLSPEEQIRTRNEQSRRDAAVLEGKRRLAASRALGSLQDMIEQEKAAQRAAAAAAPTDVDAPAGSASTNPATPANPASATPTPATTPAGPTAKATPPAPSVGEGSRTAARPAGPGAVPGPSPTAGPAAAKAGAKTPPPPPGVRAATPVGPAAPPEPAAPAEPPLLEVKQGPLATDIERMGERLAIFNDRVELHDRNGNVRQVIPGPDIADVVVHKRFTGSTVTVESGTGETIVAKGLKPDQADEIRALILKRTRQGLAAGATAPAPRARPAAAPAGPAARPAGSSSTSDERTIHINEAELLSKLTDLHEAGVLTDEELDEKVELVRRMSRGERLAASTTSTT